MYINRRNRRPMGSKIGSVRHLAGNKRAMSHVASTRYDNSATPCECRVACAQRSHQLLKQPSLEATDVAFTGRYSGRSRNLGASGRAQSKGSSSELAPKAWEQEARPSAAARVE